MGARERMLQQVRRAVAEGNRAGHAPPLGPRGDVGYQGAGPDPVARFRDEFTAAGGRPHLVPDREAAVATVLSLVRARGARRILIGRDTFLDTLNLVEALRGAGAEPVLVDTLTAEARREAFFGAEVGV